LKTKKRIIIIIIMIFNVENRIESKCNDSWKNWNSIWFGNL